MTQFFKSIFHLNLNPARSSGKSCLSGLLLALIVTPAIAQDADMDISTIQQGTHNGFYYNLWIERTGEYTGDLTFGLREAGRFTAQWSNVNNWIGGIGWNPGSRDKVVKYSGQYDVSSTQNAYLSLYGWTRVPLVDYQIVESYGSAYPDCTSNRQNHGTYQSDGATYELISCSSPDLPPSIAGETHYQYFSVRNPPKGYGAVEGTITVANHFNAWESKGLKLGQLEYMILAIDSYDGDGSVDITVAEGSPEDCGGLDDELICNSGRSGGSSGWWWLAISSLAVFRRRILSHNSSHNPL